MAFLLITFIIMFFLFLQLSLASLDGLGDLSIKRSPGLYLFNKLPMLFINDNLNFLTNFLSEFPEPILPFPAPLPPLRLPGLPRFSRRGLSLILNFIGNVLQLNRPQVQWFNSLIILLIIPTSPTLSYTPLNILMHNRINLQTLTHLIFTAKLLNTDSLH